MGIACRGRRLIRFYLASWGVPSSVCLGLSCKDLIDRSSVLRHYMRLLNHGLPHLVLWNIWINFEAWIIILFAHHACLVQVLTWNVNILEYELNFEIKDQLLVAFGKTNPLAKKPCMSSCCFFLSGQSCWVLVYSTLLNLWFSGNPIWPGSIPDGWGLSGSRSTMSDTLWMASHEYLR
jgi:hypothetical protein